MTVPFLPTLPDGSFSTSDCGLDIQTISYMGCLAAKVTPQTLDQSIEFLQSIVARFGINVSVLLDVTELQSTPDIVALLDAGAGKVFATLPQLKDLDSVKNIDPERLVLYITRERSESKEAIIEAIGGTAVDLYFHNVKEITQLQEFLRLYGDERPAVYVSLDETIHTSPQETYLHLIKSSAVPLIPASTVSVEKEPATGTIPLSSLLNIDSDRPDDLIATVVTNESGVALGLVYSSPESIQESLRTGRGVYQSRKRGLWYKGESSGDIQELIGISLDCDHDCVKFVVRQKGRGFCHLVQASCFGDYRGFYRLQQTLQARKASAPEGSYSARLFSSPQLLQAKIMEEADELCRAETKEEVAFEAADLIYFALAKCVKTGVNLEDVERELDRKSVKVKRRKGDAKGPWAEKLGPVKTADEQTKPSPPVGNGVASIPAAETDDAGKVAGRIQMRRYDTRTTTAKEVAEVLQRPSQRSTEKIMGVVEPIIKAVRERGDAALLEYTHKFEKATSLKTTVLRAPFAPELMQLPAETISAIDTSFSNIRKFHAAQTESAPLVVETMPGVTCSRFSRPIERVGLYVPGGTAILPSTALMLGVPAQVAGCKKIVIASPPRPDGSITPEIVYVAHKVGAESIVLAGGAQAVAALAYGTESVTKVDKILGPGNQFVTAGKMMVANDTSAGVSIDMPAGPSEVLVIADATANPAFVASDLLSQAEHGLDSQVVLIAVGLDERQLRAIEDELHDQAMALPRVDIVRGAIAHSITLVVKDIKEAMELSNDYAPEHLILQVADAGKVVDMVENAGSVFVGPWTPESVGDYSAGVNHSLPTYGYAKQYSGVNLASYVKHITSANLTAEGLKNVGGAVMQLAGVEQLEAHKRAVSIRLATMDKA